MTNESYFKTIRARQKRSDIQVQTTIIESKKLFNIIFWADTLPHANRQIQKHISQQIKTRLTSKSCSILDIRPFIRSFIHPFIVSQKTPFIL